MREVTGTGSRMRDEEERVGMSCESVWVGREEGLEFRVQVRIEMEITGISGALQMG